MKSTRNREESKPADRSRNPTALSQGETNLHSPSNYVTNFILSEMPEGYQGHVVVLSLDREQFSFPRTHHRALTWHLGPSRGTWKKGGRVFTGYRLRGRKTVLHFSPKNPDWFVVDFHDMTRADEQALVTFFQTNKIEHYRRHVEIALDIYPNNPDDLLDLYFLFMSHAQLPYGRAEHFKQVGPSSIRTGYWRNGKNRDKTRHFNRIYIKTDHDGKKFLRVELQVNKNHEDYGITQPVDFDQFKIEKLITFRKFDYHRAVGLAGARADRWLRENNRVDPKSHYTKTRDGRLVEVRMTDSDIMRAHIRSMMNTVERPVIRGFPPTVIEQMDAYRETFYFHPNDMGKVFPKIE